MLQEAKAHPPRSEAIHFDPTIVAQHEFMALVQVSKPDYKAILEARARFIICRYGSQITNENARTFASVYLAAQLTTDPDEKSELFGQYHTFIGNSTHLPADIPTLTGLATSISQRHLNDDQLAPETAQYLAAMYGREPKYFDQAAQLRVAAFRHIEAFTRTQIPVAKQEAQQRLVESYQALSRVISIKP